MMTNEDWTAIQEVTHPDFIWGAMDNVHDCDVSLDDYAAAVSRAQRAALADRADAADGELARLRAQLEGRDYEC